MKKYWVNLPETAMECEVLRRAGFPVIFTKEEYAHIIKVQRTDYIKLCNSEEYPVLYYDHQHGFLCNLPIWIDEAGGAYSPDAKIRKSGCDVMDATIDVWKMKEDGDWIGIYKQMPKEFRLQVFMENFNKIHLEQVYDVFEFIANEEDITIDDLPEHMANYIKEALVKTEDIKNVVIEKLRQIRAAYDCDNDVVFSYNDRQYLEKFEEEWIERMEEEEIPVERE